MICMKTCKNTARMEQLYDQIRDLQEEIRWLEGDNDHWEEMWNNRTEVTLRWYEKALRAVFS